MLLDQIKVVPADSCVACARQTKTTIIELCNQHHKMCQKFLEIFDEKLRRRMPDSLDPFTYLKDSVREALLKTEVTSQRVFQICVEFSKNPPTSFRNVHESHVYMSCLGVWMNMFLHDVRAEIQRVTNDLWDALGATRDTGDLFCNIFLDCNEILNFIARWDRDRDVSMKKASHLCDDLMQVYKSGEPERTILASMSKCVSELSPIAQNVPQLTQDVPANSKMQSENQVSKQEEKKMECPLCVADEFKTLPNKQSAIFPSSTSYVKMIENCDELCRQHKNVYLSFKLTFEVEFARKAHACIFVCEELQQKIKSHPITCLDPVIESCVTFPQINGVHLVTFESMYTDHLVPMPGLPALLRSCIFASRINIFRLMNSIVASVEDVPEAKTAVKDMQLHLQEYVVLYERSKDFESFLKKLDVIRSASYNAAYKLQQEIMQRHFQYLLKNSGTKNDALICLMDIFSIACRKSAPQ